MRRARGEVQSSGNVTVRTAFTRPGLAESTMTRSAVLMASDRSCVTKTAVFFSRRRMELMSSQTDSRVW